MREQCELRGLGVNVVAICSDDAEKCSGEGFANMVKFAKERGLSFVYLHDETQEVARQYDAQFTPEFFGLNAGLKRQYWGRLDASRRAGGDPELRRYHVKAMKKVTATGDGTDAHNSSMGCSIKWHGKVQ